MRIIFGIGLCLELSSIWFTLSVIFGTEHELYVPVLLVHNTQ